MKSRQFEVIPKCRTAKGVKWGAKRKPLRGWGMEAEGEEGGVGPEVLPGRFTKQVPQGLQTVSKHRPEGGEKVT